MKSRLLLIFIATASGGAAYAETRNNVFVSPRDYVGRTVLVCGYMIDNSNILESRLRREWGRTSGLSIRSRGPLPARFLGRACVEGEISYLGCETEACTGAGFDYAISISRVISMRRGPGHGE